MSRKYKYLLLDADGTVLDFEKAERTALQGTFEAFGLEACDQAVRDYHSINKQLWEALERGEVTRERLSTLRFERLGEKYPQAGAEMAPVYVEKLSGCAFFLPGAEEFLAEAAAVCDIAIVTNGITAVQKGRLSLAGMDRFARCAVISQEMGTSKPDPKLAFAALELLGCHDKKQALVAGDSISADIRMGINAGIDTCLMFSRSGQASYCAQSYEELLRLLGD